MCGIHGFCWQDTDDSMGRMVAAAAHRGPDGSGIWRGPDLTLGHNLLAIADLASVSAQPWVTDRSVLVFNGEIYNYRALRDELTGPFTTDSDTEVLVAGLEQKGPDFLERIDGMFALAFYDKVSRELLLARDSNGAKPLYFGLLRGRLAFSSEIRSLLELGFDRQISRDGFRHYYYSGLVTGPLTMFQGINKLVPGEVRQINVKSGRFRSSNLNNVPPGVYRGRESDLPRLLAERLRRSVELTLTGRRTVGMFLSGGLDSSSILYEATHGLGVQPRTFTTRFELPNSKCNHNSDADAARDLAKACGTEHREILVGEQRWVDSLVRAVTALEEPRQNKSLPAYYATHGLARASGTVVVLTGDGGDELLMGYKHQRNTPFRNRLEALRSGHRKLPDGALDLPLDEQVAYLDSWLPRGGLTGDSVNDFMYTECLHSLSEDFLIRNDKLGMAFSMEARFPMMCRVFRDFVRSIPGRFKSAPTTFGSWDSNNKVLLRRAYTSKLPVYITSKKKTGWRAPTDGWLIGLAGYPARDDGPVRAYFRHLLEDPLARDLFGVTKSDIEDRYLNNRDHLGANKPSGKPGAGPGLRAQKELFTVVMFIAWAQALRVRIW